MTPAQVEALLENPEFTAAQIGAALFSASSSILPTPRWPSSGRAR